MGLILDCENMGKSFYVNGRANGMDGQCEESI